MEADIKQERARQQLVEPPCDVSPRIVDTRIDVLTAQRVEVAMVFMTMVNITEAALYLRDVGVPDEVMCRVLMRPENRRGKHDAQGLRVDIY